MENQASAVGNQLDNESKLYSDRIHSPKKKVYSILEGLGLNF